MEADDPKLLVAGADVVVRTIASGYRAAHEQPSRPPARGPATLIEFKVLEVLKGENVPEFLHVAGYLNDKDDFNPPATPPHSIRPDGRGGSCYAYQYKKGGKFLLILKRRDGDLTPYWASMAATNQQLRGADDPWLRRVKAALAARRPD